MDKVELTCGSRLRQNLPLMIRVSLPTKNNCFSMDHCYNCGRILRIWQIMVVKYAIHRVKTVDIKVNHLGDKTYWWR